MRMIATFLKLVLARIRGRALDLEVGRTRLWLHPDGTILPAIAGADGADEEPETEPDEEPEVEADPEPEEEPSDEEPTPEPEDDFDKERALRTIRKQRAEEKKLKAERDKIKAERDEMRRERETEQERVIRERDEAKAEAERLREEARSAKVSVALRDAAIEAGIDPKRVKKVLRRVDRSNIEIDEDGDVIGAEQAIEEFLEDFPEVQAGPADPEPDPDPSDEPKRRSPGANPDRKRSKGGEMSHKDAVRLATQDPEKFAELLAEGKISREALGGSEYDRKKREGKLSTASTELEAA